MKGANSGSSIDRSGSGGGREESDSGGGRGELASVSTPMGKLKIPSLDEVLIASGERGNSSKSSGKGGISNTVPPISWNNCTPEPFAVKEGAWSHTEECAHGTVVTVIAYLIAGRYLMTALPEEGGWKNRPPLPWSTPLVCRPRDGHMGS